MRRRERHGSGPERRRPRSVAWRARTRRLGRRSVVWRWRRHLLIHSRRGRRGQVSRRGGPRKRRRRASSWRQQRALAAHRGLQRGSGTWEKIVMICLPNQIESLPCCACTGGENGKRGGGGDVVRVCDGAGGCVGGMPSSVGVERVWIMGEVPEPDRGSEPSPTLAVFGNAPRFI